jgi:hypothetical protein
MCMLEDVPVRPHRRCRVLQSERVDLQASTGETLHWVGVESSSYRELTAEGTCFINSKEVSFAWRAESLSVPIASWQETKRLATHGRETSQYLTPLAFKH